MRFKASIVCTAHSAEKSGGGGGEEEDVFELGDDEMSGAGGGGLGWNVRLKNSEPDGLAGWQRVSARLNGRVHEGKGNEMGGIENHSGDEEEEGEVDEEREREVIIPTDILPPFISSLQNTPTNYSNRITSYSPHNPSSNIGRARVELEKKKKFNWKEAPKNTRFVDDNYV